MLKTEDNKFFTKQNVFPLLIAAVATVFNCISVFFLPQKIVTGVEMFGKGTPTTDRISFLVIATCMILASSAMSVFTDRQKKWASVAAVLLFLDVLCIVVNLI